MSYSEIQLVHVEQLLGWYFSVGMQEAGTAHGSTFAATMRRAEQYGLRGTRCLVCGGTGEALLVHWKVELRDGVEVKFADEIRLANACDACHGSGAIEVGGIRRGRQEFWTTARCRPCKGSGRRLKRLDPLIESILVEPGTDPMQCPECKGRRYHDHQVPSVGHGPQQHVASGYSIDEPAVRWAGMLARVLATANERMPNATKVLAVFYGHLGQGQALRDRPREFSLLPLTEGGRWLAAQGESLNPQKPNASPEEHALAWFDLIQSQIDREAENPTGPRSRAIRSARAEARLLIASARAAMYQADIDHGGQILDKCIGPETRKLTAQTEKA